MSETTAASSEKPPRVGIDLGTTFSAVSYYDEFKRDVITIDVDPFAGTSTLRSVVYFEPVLDGDGNFQHHNVIVGETAYRKRLADEDRVISHIKREIGTPWKRTIDGVELTTELVSAEILKALIAKAREVIGEISEVVVTVPAYFGDAERAITRAAVEATGVKLLKLLEEPAAAALAYSLEKYEQLENRLVLVYDLGGGTFDATLARTNSRAGGNGAPSTLEVDTLAKEGLRIRGGIDWNNRLQEHVAAKAQDEFQIDPLAQLATRLTFEEQCEEAKRMLSTSTTTDVMVTLMGQTVSVTRETFEDITANELAETEALFRLIVDEAEARLRQEMQDDDSVKQRYAEEIRSRMEANPDEWSKVLEIARDEHGLTQEQIQASPADLLDAMPRVAIDVLLCGGSTKMPMVTKMIRDVMGRKPVTHGNPELLVTRGAAYAAYVHTDEDAEDSPPKTIETPGGVVVVEPMSSVVAETIGVETISSTDRKSKEFAAVLPKGSTMGEEKTLKLSTSEDNMTVIPIIIRESPDPESKSLSGTRLLGEAAIEVPPGRPAGQRVDLTVWLDTDGIICGSAKDVSTGKEVEFRFTRENQ